MDTRTALGLGVLLTVSVSACRGEPRALEPRSPPPRIAPNVPIPAAPVAPHHARVVLHSTDESLQITARADTAFVPPGHPVPPSRTGELCTTPCVADLPIGRYKLFMTSADGSYDQSDTDTLEVREGLNYYLRAPGKFEEPTWIPVLPTVLTVLGVAAIAGGVALASNSEDTRTTGILIAGGGAALTITGGILMYDAGRGAIQKGATTTWTQPLGGPQ
jgi:hypothetical protein